MIKFIVNFLSLLIFIITLTAADLQASTLRIATYNIWNPVFEEKYSGQNTWNQRLPFILENIISSESDVLCLEEVAENSYLDLIQNEEINRRYLSFYLSHAPSKPGQKEGRDGLAFFYNPEKVTFVKMNPSLDGTRPTHRRDLSIDLKLNETLAGPVHFRVALTHLDSEKDLTIGNRQLSALVEETLQFDHEKELDFIIICGDFNEGENELERPRHDIMQHAGFMTDGSVKTTRPEALNVRHNGHVDWIYFKNMTGLNIDLISLPPIGNEKASDHKLTITDVNIK